MGRPRLPPEQKAVERTVRLCPAAFDAGYRLAQQQGVSVNALMKRILERVLTHHTIRGRVDPWYGANQSSTLSGVLSESPSSRADRDAGPSSLR